MQFSEITSSQNPSVKHLVKLRDRRPREKERRGTDLLRAVNQEKKTPLHPWKWGVTVFLPLYGFGVGAGFHAEALVTAVGAGQLAGVGGVRGEKGLLEGGLENFMALGADIGHASEVVTADEDAVGNGHAGPDNKQPPDAREDPK